MPPSIGPFFVYRGVEKFGLSGFKSNASNSVVASILVTREGEHFANEFKSI